MINLGDKNWGVKDSGLLAYKQVGSRFFNKDFDFTRASNGTYVDKDGVLQTAELYNLIDYSQDFSQWFKLSTTGLTNGYSAPNGQNQAYSIEHTGTVGQYYVSDTSVNLPSAIVNYSVYVKKGTKNWVALRVGNICIQYFDIENFVLGNYTFAPPLSYNFEEVGNGWVRLSMTVLGNGASNTISVYALENGTTIDPVGSDGDKLIYIYGAQLVEGTEPLDYQYTNGRVGIPRIDFSDGVGALLLEPQRTNLYPYSEYSSVWNKTNWTTTDNYAISPEGVQNAFRAVSSDTSGILWISGTGTTGQDNTLSVWAKSNTGGDQKFRFFANGLTTTSSDFTATTEWQRFEYTYNCTFVTSGIKGASSELSDILFYGFQHEVGSYATSYIKTEGSAVTRIADVANNCGSEQDFNSEEGVLYAEVASQNDGGYKFITLSDGTATNRIGIFLGNVDNKVSAESSGSGVNLGIYEKNITTSDYNKIALKYKANDCSLWLNGVEIGTDTTFAAFSPNVLTQIDFSRTSVLPFYGKVRSVKYFPEALGDTRLMTLTGGDGSLQGLLNAFRTRVIADGGTIEAETCIKNEIKELL